VLWLIEQKNAGLTKVDPFPCKFLRQTLYCY